VTILATVPHQLISFLKRGEGLWFQA